MSPEPAEKLTRLRFYARLTGRSHGDMGALLGVSGVSFGRYLSGDRAPRRKVADRIKEISRGVIHAGNYADEIGAEEAAVMMAEIARREAAAQPDGACHD
ncbi:MAG: hypothetical protein IPK75_01505 [Acidobacteria bacterium]|nr:hypothetical protein [Acidobacteriota bacterium]